MRISPTQSKLIKKLAIEMVGHEAIIKLFGSRLDDMQRGGDVDLLIEYPHSIDNPAWLAARLSAKISRMMSGRQVDILLCAPNLTQLAIHTHAKQTGQLL